MLQGILPIVHRRLFLENAARSHVVKRSITASAVQWLKKMPDKPAPPPEDEFTEAFLKGSGPGGQKINKTSSAVQLRHLPTGIVLKVQAHRSRSQNRKLARQMLAERIEVLEKGKESRVAVVGEKKRKKKSSATKKSKRKYRLLDEAKAKEKAAEEDEDA
ncbi:hypothetical protein G7Y89_g13466 [Cudoniella acicularis]|uniref:Prokaryotic-type class I peptide chain release factors domain-containing protein n=1 Tax=Cudoniella acicularis TaxID=354080 RepID=A0A8H4VWE6_9HELO|nr:hypothetical protein G7Y89_g13466 [Cudoniella acicularis]